MNEEQESMNDQEVFPYVEASRRLYERLDRLYKELDIPTGPFGQVQLSTGNGMVLLMQALVRRFQFVNVSSRYIEWSRGVWKWQVILEADVDGQPQSRFREGTTLSTGACADSPPQALVQAAVKLLDVVEQYKSGIYEDEDIDEDQAP